MAEIWAAAIAAGTAVAGTYMSYKGAQDQKKANQDAQNQNASQFAASQNQNWTNYLLTRGINPGPGGVKTGAVPTSGFTAVNTKLPLWANVSDTPSGGGFLIKKDAAGVKPVTFDYHFSTDPITGSQVAAPETAAAATSPGGRSFLQKATDDHLKILDPLGGLKKLFG